MGQLAKSPLADPSKNPAAAEMLGGGMAPEGAPQAAEAAPDPELTAPVPGAQ